MLTTGDSIVLEAFLKALVQLEQPLDEVTEKALIQVIENLETLAQNSPPLKQEYDKARLELVKNYQSQSRIKFVSASEQSSIGEASQSVFVPNQESSMLGQDLSPSPKKKTPLEIFEENGLVGCFAEETDSVASTHEFSKLDLEKAFHQILGAPDSISTAKRMSRVISVFERAVEVLENQTSAWNWLNRSNPALGEVIPLDLLETEEGAEQVNTLLGRIEYGVYS
jgi:uncharacterized protein (DUF2384 family)